MFFQSVSSSIKWDDNIDPPAAPEEWKDEKIMSGKTQGLVCSRVW